MVCQDGFSPVPLNGHALANMKGFRPFAAVVEPLARLRAVGEER